MVVYVMTLEKSVIRQTSLGFVMYEFSSAVVLRIITVTQLFMSGPYTRLYSTLKRKKKNNWL